MDIVATISQSPVERFASTTDEEISTTVHLESLRGSGATIDTYGWIPAANAAAFLDAAECSDYILATERLDERGDEALVRLDWYEHRVPLLGALLQSEVSVLGGRLTDESWQLVVRFETETELRRFSRNCQEDGIDMAVESVRARSKLCGTELASQLTDAQLETLEYALLHGYYDVPRKTNVTKIADEFGVSDTAVSQRIRRGLKKLLTVIYEDVNGEEPPVDDAGE